MRVSIFVGFVLATFASIVRGEDLDLASRLDAGKNLGVVHTFSVEYHEFDVDAATQQRIGELAQSIVGTPLNSLQLKKAARDIEQTLARPSHENVLAEAHLETLPSGKIVVCILVSRLPPPKPAQRSMITLPENRDAKPGVNLIF